MIRTLQLALAAVCRAILLKIFQVSSSAYMVLASFVHGFGRDTSLVVVIFCSYVGMPTDRIYTVYFS